MVTNSLHFDGVETFSVDIIVFVLRGSLQSDVSSVKHTQLHKGTLRGGRARFLLWHIRRLSMALDKAWLF